MAVKKWRGKWVVDLVVDGRRIRRVSPVQTRRGAKAFEVELLREAAEAPAPKAEAVPEVPTLAAFADDWMATAVAVQNKPSERTRKRSILRNHLAPFFGKRRLDQITRRDVEGFKGHQIEKGLAVGTVNRHVELLARLMRCATEWGVLEQMPIIRGLPGEKAETDWLRPAEATKLLDAAKAMSAKWFTFILLALRTGLRRGEIFALHWSEVDFERRRLTVRYSVWKGQLGTPKSGRSRVVPMSSDLVEVLTAWRRYSSGDVVFPGRSGGLAYTHTSANSALNRALARAGVRQVRFHDLRHTFASHLVLQGCSLKVVQELMGHHSVTMTERYAHVGDDQLVAAVEMLDGLGEGDDKG